MDYSILVDSIKQKHSNMKVVAFGGSYGGMLSAWARMKYPNVFDMALAASAPITQILGLNDKKLFYKLVTQDAEQADPKCPVRVREAFAQVTHKFKSAQGRQEIQRIFNLCNPVEESELSHFVQYARNAWTEMAMCDYPYASSFLAPLPAWPVKAACKAVKEGSTAIEGLAAAVAMPYKSDAKCFDMYTIFIECADQTGCGTGNDAKAWDYQMCTELFYEQQTNNKTDMFPFRDWTLEDLNEYCQKHYQVSIDPQFDRISVLGTDIAKVSSHIIFSNGLLDPWHGGGFMESLSKTLPAVIVKDGAHHLDLRMKNPEDPQSVIDARLKEKAYISTWLAGMEETIIA